MCRTVPVLILAVLALPFSAVRQQVEQAPSMEACIADLNSWSSGLNDIPFGDRVRSVGPETIGTERNVSKTCDS